MTSIEYTLYPKMVHSKVQAFDINKHSGRVPKVRTNELYHFILFQKVLHTCEYNCLNKKLQSSAKHACLDQNTNVRNCTHLTNWCLDKPEQGTCALGLEGVS